MDYYTDYCYTISAVRNKSESKKSNVVCAKTLDLPISTPEDFVAEATSTSSITLTWNKAQNALSYNIYNNDVLIANEYILKGLTIVKPATGKVNEHYRRETSDILDDWLRRNVEFNI
mgnify:CR=1 FL=1